MENFREYLAVYAFRNETDSQLDLVVNDIIEVPISSLQQHVDVPGLVKGRNKRSGMEGYFPGTSFNLQIFKICSQQIHEPTHVSIVFVTVSYLTPLDRKAENQSSGIYVYARLQGSPVKSQLMNKLEDYNDSGYGGSPLPPGQWKQQKCIFAVRDYRDQFEL